MNTSKTEFLSALLDDEAGEFEQRRMLDELKKDDELGQTLSRYALIGEAMRAGNSGQRFGASTSLLARIHDELDDEPEYNETVVAFPAAKPRYSYRTVGMGMAAAVAALAVGGLLFMQHPNQPSVQAVAQLPVASQASMAVAANANTDVDTRIQQVGRIDPATRDVLKQYVAQHVKYASTTTFAPTVRAVSYANER